MSYTLVAAILPIPDLRCEWLMHGVVAAPTLPITLVFTVLILNSRSPFQQACVVVETNHKLLFKEKEETLPYLSVWLLP